MNVSHPPGGLRKAIARNLRAGVDLALLRRRYPDDFITGAGAVAALLLIDLALYGLIDALRADADSVFEPDGAITLGFYLFLGVLACAGIARASGEDGRTRSLLVPLLAAAAPVLALFGILGTRLAERPFTAVLLATLYLAAVSLRVLRAAFGHVRTGAAVVTVALVVLAPALIQTIGVSMSFWDVPAGDAANDEDATAAEPLLYEQPARIAAAVAHLREGEAGHPNVWIVGFAGDGDQAVFGRETLLAGQVFADHYAAGGRTLQLINDVEDRDTYPIASMSGLALALQRIAARMDLERDVLVLTLSSHGSPEGLAVTNGSLPLNTLSPADLRHALDVAGIRWRIVVVSACYAGVFLEPLRSEGTLVITAADATHTSFGCDDANELTDFGRAFLKEALPGASTLEVAFARARDTIVQRENEAHEEHSNPQLWVGARIRQKLADLEALHGDQPAQVVRR